MPQDTDLLTYSSYLKVGELLELQKPLSEPVAHDEMLFIIIHQTYELWFKQILFEMEALITRLDRDEHIAAFRLFTRIFSILDVLIEQVDILETMTPIEFNRFRSKLNPASGFQSFQFRELELMSGADPADYTKFFALEPEWKARLMDRGNRPNLRTTFFGVLKRSGKLNGTDSAAVIQAILAAYQDPKVVAVQKICEQLIQFDESIALWRFRHVQMVERMIGMKAGTGGSLGVAYLQTTLKKRFFPELWESRTHMGGTAY